MNNDLTSASSPETPRGFERLDAAFVALGVTPPIVEHEAVFTVAESQDLRGRIPGVHTKNLFLKDKKGALFLITAPEDADIDLKRIHTLIGARGRVSFASAELLAQHLGVLPGSVTPLALINDDTNAVTCILHPEVANAELVNMHPLRNTATVTLTGAALCALLTGAGHPPQRLESPPEEGGAA